jgi:hypothetical protein
MLWSNPVDQSQAGAAQLLPCQHRLAAPWHVPGSRHVGLGHLVHRPSLLELSRLHAEGPPFPHHCLLPGRRPSAVAVVGLRQPRAGQQMWCRGIGGFGGQLSCGHRTATGRQDITSKDSPNKTAAHAKHPPGLLSIAPPCQKQSIQATVRQEELPCRVAVQAKAAKCINQLRVASTTRAAHIVPSHTRCLWILHQGL